MKRNRKMVISLVVVGAVMLSGCGAASSAVSGSAAASGAPSVGAVSSAAASSAAASSAAAADSVAPATYAPEELTAALDSCCDFEADSAGGSLKVTIAAANIVAFSAQYGGEKVMDIDTLTWYQGLSEEQLAALDLNWDLIHADALALCTDPASMTDKLSEAGVETDFSTVDLTSAASLMNVMNSLIRQSW